MFRKCLRYFLFDLKATPICVAFFVLISFSVLAAPVKKNIEQNNINSLKKIVNSLMVKKNRAQAIKLLEASIAAAQSQGFKIKILAMKENVLSIFLSQESQNLFESSAAQLVQKTNQSEKDILQCLDLEPENLLCRWQYLKVLNYKNNLSFKAESQRFMTDTENLPYFGTLAATLNLTVELKKSFRAMNLLKTSPILYFIFEFERSLSAKNYSLAKEVLQKLTNLAPDYPDLIFMKMRLMDLSQEDILREKNSDVIYDLYKKTCSSLRPELTRKYFYDIHLCHRSF